MAFIDLLLTKCMLKSKTTKETNLDSFFNLLSKISNINDNLYCNRKKPKNRFRFSSDNLIYLSYVSWFILMTKELKKIITYIFIKYFLNRCLILTQKIRKKFKQFIK